MIGNEALTQYATALKAGRDCYRRRVIKGEYPYLQALDEIITDRFTAGYVDIGLIEAPAEMIVGTATVGRRDAFAANFMPLLPAESEFGMKWIALCEANLSDEGIRDPVRCFEYLGRFYVLEGNKRVSVLKSFGAPTVMANVTRIIPPWSEDEEIVLYYEFMEFYRLSKIYTVRFEKRGHYGSLQAALGFEPDHVWTEDERRTFNSAWAKFSAAAGRRASAELFLSWLKIYGFEKLKDIGSAELESSIAGVVPDTKLQSDESPIDVSTSPGEAKGGIITKLIGAVTLPNRLSVAFINDYSPDESHWIASHDLGRRQLEEYFGKKIDVRVYNGTRGGDVDSLFDLAVKGGADMIFATTPTLINSCRRAAAKYPSVKILNCSVSMPFPGVRTYYSRIYEGKFVTGAVAGAMTKTGRVGYVASNPIYGVPAGINAFALGAKLTNPDVKIVLRWSCCTVDAFGELRGEGCDMISTRDVPSAVADQSVYGLLRVEGDGTLTPMISPVWEWGKFYVRIVESVFTGAWDEFGSRSQKALNYWWGFDAGAVDLRASDAIPESMAQLAEIMKRGVASGQIPPFGRRLVAQDGTVVTDGERVVTPDEILHMDYLESCVEGRIPSFDELLPIARPIVRLQGIYRDTIPPDKDEMQI